MLSKAWVAPLLYLRWFSLIFHYDRFSSPILYLEHGFQNFFHSVIPLRVSTTLKHTLNRFAIKIKVWKNSSAVWEEKQVTFLLFWTLKKGGKHSGDSGK